MIQLAPAPCVSLRFRAGWPNHFQICVSNNWKTRESSFGQDVQKQWLSEAQALPHRGATQIFVQTYVHLPFPENTIPDEFMGPAPVGNGDQSSKDELLQ